MLIALVCITITAHARSSLKKALTSLTCCDVIDEVTLAASLRYTQKAETNCAVLHPRVSLSCLGLLHLHALFASGKQQLSSPVMLRTSGATRPLHHPSYILCNAVSFSQNTTGRFDAPSVTLTRSCQTCYVPCGPNALVARGLASSSISLLSSC